MHEPPNFRHLESSRGFKFFNLVDELRVMSLTSPLKLFLNHRQLLIDQRKFFTSGTEIRHFLVFGRETGKELSLVS